MSGSMKTIFHVRFFGDKGKRAWVVETKLMFYNDKSDVEVLLKKVKEEVSDFVCFPARNTPVIDLVGTS